MLNAARVQGRPMMVIAIATAAITQPTAIHRPPQTIHSRFRSTDMGDIGQTLAQSNAINRYVGKLADFYPTDAWQAGLCDEVMEAVEDINTKLAPTFFLPDEEKKTQRKALAEGPLPFYLTRLQQRLEAHGGRYFAANSLTVADLKVFVWIRHLRSGVLDHIPADLPDRVAPKLVDHYERVKNDPRVQAYYDKHGVAA